MAMQATPIPAADQVEQLRKQLFDDLLKAAALERDLADVKVRVLAVTNILGGVDLGKSAIIEHAQAEAARKLAAAPADSPAPVET
jgi:hypothetical protein